MSTLELQALPDPFRRLLNTLHVGVFTLDAGGKVLGWSEGAEQLSGLTSADVVGKDCGRLTHMSGGNGIPGLLELALGSKQVGNVEATLCLRHERGHELYVLASLSALEGGYVGCLTDLTAHAQTNRRLAEVRSPERTRRAFDQMIGESPLMDDVFDRLKKAAGIDVTVLIRGETGTGKELAASAIHALSNRRDKPLVCVNCSAIPEPLLESELFGHVKGAFTGALRSKRGVFEAAEGGTLFLDEIGDMGSRMQVKLLRALQERVVRRVGSEKVIPVDARILSATNRDLSQLIAEQTFREDLYYRIRVYDVTLPPLRERTGDIPILTRHFVEVLNLRHQRGVRGLSPSAMNCLKAYRWPGNVRELRNAVEHAFVTVADELIQPDDLPVEVRVSAARAEREPAAAPAQGPDSGSEERERIVMALRESRGKKGLAAAILGISRVTLWKRIKEHEIEPYQEAP